MGDPITSPFSPWESFYVIVGSSGAALTGLQFVVMALVADAERKGGEDTIGAFATPTVIHFCVVLGIAGLLSAPWANVGAPAFLLSLAGILGLVYAGVITARARRQTDYKPVFEDWLWHSILPAIAYLLLTIGGLSFWRSHRNGLFLVAATTMMLLFIGIHNAWDSVAYVASAQYRQGPPKPEA
jgi:hypothetical protein